MCQQLAQSDAVAKMLSAACGAPELNVHSPLRKSSSNMFRTKSGITIQKLQLQHLTPSSHSSYLASLSTPPPPPDKTKHNKKEKDKNKNRKQEKEDQFSRKEAEEKSLNKREREKEKNKKNEDKEKPRHKKPKRQVKWTDDKHDHFKNSREFGELRQEKVSLPVRSGDSSSSSIVTIPIINGDSESRKEDDDRRILNDRLRSTLYLALCWISVLMAVVGGYLCGYYFAAFEHTTASSSSSSMSSCTAVKDNAASQQQQQQLGAAMSYSAELLLLISCGGAMFAFVGLFSLYYHYHHYHHHHHNHHKLE